MVDGQLHESIPLDAPIGGVPPLIDTAEGLEGAVTDLAQGVGPIGIDTERASGFRYSQRAYLIQLFREGSGTFLIDPTRVGSLEALQRVIEPELWILHAAPMDLPCLGEAGLTPTRLFDTELAARLLNLPRVGLGPVVEDLLGFHLAKEHSAADWSKRPLDDALLAYAALDVQLLPDLYETMTEMLDHAGKLEIAREEFESLLDFHPKPPMLEPWRKISGVSRLANRTKLAQVRALWTARDQLARKRDVAPGRLIPDRSIVAAVSADPKTKGELARLKAFTGRASRSELDFWWEAIKAGRASRTPPTLKGPERKAPPPRAWRDRNPLAFHRLNIARHDLTLLAVHEDIPHENLLAPAVLREACLEMPELTPGVDRLGDELARHGARRWQIERTAPVLVGAFAAAADIPLTTPHGGDRR